MSKRKQPPPAALTTRSSTKATHTEASWSNPCKDLVASITLDNTMASIHYETVELIDTAIEQSQATTQGFIMTQFERISANFGLPHGQPPHPPTADNGAYSRSDMHNTRVYEPDPYIFDEEQPRHGQFDDSILRRSMRTQAPSFT
jgi:predicted YcjX-like family ATPase